MENIIVEVQVPSASGTYDFMLPSDLTAAQAIEAICDVAEAQERSVRFDRASTHLVDMDGRKVLDGALALGEQSIRDGTQLMLI